MKLVSSLTARISLLLLAAAPALASPGGPVRKAVLSAPASAERFLQVCTSQLALDELQRNSLREYLEQEMNFMAVQRANHGAAEVARLLPAERAEFQEVTSRLMSPTQLRRFRELQATPRMREYLRQMDLAN